MDSKSGEGALDASVVNDVSVLSVTSIPASSNVSDTKLVPQTFEVKDEEPPDVEPRKERNLVMKLDLRILGPSILIFLLCFLDRSNIGNARILNQDTGHSLVQTLNLSGYQFMVSLMLFLITYTVFESPSNFMLKRFRPSRWIAFLMMAWGALTMCLAAAHSYAALNAVRILLGAAEAGLFPGLVFVLTFWYKPNERLLRIAPIFASGSAAGAFGGAIAYGIGHLNGKNGLEGWRWLFILEGLPSCVMSIYVFFCFPDWPETAMWLSAEERLLAVRRLRGDASSSKSQTTWKDIKETLAQWRLAVHYLVYVCIAIPFGSLSLFSPSIVTGLGYSGLRAQLFTVPPYACAYVVTIAIAVSAERTNARSVHALLAMLTSSAAFLAQALIPATSFKARYSLFCIAASGSFACIPPLVGWLSSNLHTTTAAGLALGINISFGGVGQIVGTWIYPITDAPRYLKGHFINFGVLLVGSVLVIGLRFFYQHKNKRLSVGEKMWVL
ncbi:hypothetical protein BOTBODRAFT_135209 [Botryobasidium botryosum FD-172 SS1]|uniref:Major facilitator superfamily (MFS) profile domain-containing protein n=1 Tax=Botryobasidium botryosum (strain FD-172 SS1) TaxID=930990 RepID=A0A067MJH1_BOTB1|nr:hypothetical protein BOTBODRAFT_135209 [Botryobasidium botryosum FD-172 SS1]